jgi:AcrR family transcriptional regulator
LGFIAVVDHSAAPGAPYHHFKDRQSLLGELATEGYTRLLGEMQRAAATHQRGQEKLVALAKTYLRFSEQNAAYYRVIFSAEVSEIKDRPELQQIADKCLGLVTKTISNQDITDKQRAELSVSLWAFLHGINALHHNQMLQSLPRAEQERIAVKAVTAMVRGASSSQ